MTDLHLHFDGSLSPAIARRLLELDGHDEAPGLSDAELRQLLTAGSSCHDLNEYLSKFVFPLSLLQTPEQVRTCVAMLREELAGLGVDYAELRFAPQSLCERGYSQQQIVEAAIDGLAGPGTPARLILCCMRGANNEEENLATVRLAHAFLGRGVCALDLAGAEALFPTSSFASLFELARKLDVPFTIHAGEASGPQSVWDALSFGARRIGHGVRAAEDPRLLEELARREVVLELCPTSNLNTCVFSRYDQIPLRTFLDAGVRVTINSDNMAVSDTNVVREFDLMRQTFSLADDELAQLHHTAELARF